MHVQGITDLSHILFMFKEFKKFQKTYSLSKEALDATTIFVWSKKPRSTKLQLKHKYRQTASVVIKQDTF